MSNLQPAGGYIPGPELTAGEIAALSAADRDGWIAPPVYDCLAPAPRAAWGVGDLASLWRRGMMASRVHRRDGLYVYRVRPS